MQISAVIFVIVILVLLVLLALGTDPVKIGTAALLLIAVEMMMGVDLLQIGIGMLSLIFLAFSLMLMFFSVSLIAFIFFRPGRAVFDKIEPLKQSRAGFASYLMDGEVFYCIYPIEFMITGYFYGKKKDTAVRFFRFRKRNVLFDGYSRVVLLIGFCFSSLFFVILYSVLGTLLSL